MDEVNNGYNDHKSLTQEPPVYCMDLPVDIGVCSALSVNGGTDKREKQEDQHMDSTSLESCRGPKYDVSLASLS